VTGKPARLLWQARLWDDEDQKPWGPERRVVRTGAGLIRVEMLQSDGLGEDAWIASNSENYVNEIEFMKQAIERMREQIDALTEAPEPPNV
jgi:hypothetical protein